MGRLISQQPSEPAILLKSSMGPEEVEGKHRAHGEGLFLGSSFNLASAAIGLGILSLPYTIQNAGIILGGTLFVLMGLVTVYSLDVLVSAAELCGKYTYQDTVKEAFGQSISTLTGGIIIWHASGSTISSFMIVADLLTPVFKEGHLLHNRTLLMFLALIVLFPLCYLRKINSLRHASGGAIISFLYMAGLVIVSYFVIGQTTDGLEYVGGGVNVARSIPIIVYAYTCHTMAIPVYAELQDRSSRYMFRVIWGGVFMSFVLYLSVGIFGYLTFGDVIKDNVLLNYSHEDKEVLVGRILICSAIILGYPMSSWVMRDSFEQIYFYFKEKRARYHKLDLEDVDENTTLTGGVDRTVSRKQNLLETLVILGASVGIAIAVPKINVVFGLVGSTSSVTLNFILPGLMYIKLLNKFPPKITNRSLQTRKIGALILIVFGIALGIMGTTTTIIGFF